MFFSQSEGPLSRPLPADLPTEDIMGDHENARSGQPQSADDGAGERIQLKQHPRERMQQIQNNQAAEAAQSVDQHLPPKAHRQGNDEQ